MLPVQIGLVLPLVRLTTTALLFCLVCRFALDGEAESAFSVTVVECGGDTAHFDITSSDLNDLTGNNPYTVTLQNLQHIDVTDYCFKVSLFVNGLTGAISETTYTYGESSSLVTSLVAISTPVCSY